MTCCRRKQSSPLKAQAPPCATTTSNNCIPSDYKFKPYFHGLLPRDDVIQLLENQGDFILRITEPCTSPDCSEDATPPPPEAVISVKWDGLVKHFIIQHQHNKYYVEPNKVFNSVSELVEFYHVSGTPIRGNICINNPVPHAQWELEHEQITIGKKLGSGEFGDVHMGTLLETKGDPPVQVQTEVAIKISKTMSPKQRRQFMTEARMMRHYNHPNIVRMVGVAAQKEPLMLLIELAKGGCLKDYLLQNKDKITPNERLKLCLDGAKGMEYLESKHCIHRDLAARNCLLSDDLTVKISDFGLSKETELYQMSESDGKRKVPIRWLAPESITRKIFNRQTDVWSFGIVMWEIYMNAAQPYPEYEDNITVMKQVGGYRRHMKAPDSMPPAVAEVLLKCWKPFPADRPTFEQVRQGLENAMETDKPAVTQEKSPKTKKGAVDSIMAAKTQKTDKVKAAPKTQTAAKGQDTSVKKSLMGTAPSPKKDSAPNGDQKLANVSSISKKSFEGGVADSKPSESVPASQDKSKKQSTVLQYKGDNK